MKSLGEVGCALTESSLGLMVSRLHRGRLGNIIFLAMLVPVKFGCAKEIVDARKASCSRFSLNDSYPSTQ